MTKAQIVTRIARLEKSLEKQKNFAMRLIDESVLKRLKEELESAGA